MQLLCDYEDQDRSKQRTRGQICRHGTLIIVPHATPMCAVIELQGTFRIALERWS